MKNEIIGMFMLVCVYYIHHSMYYVTEEYKYLPSFWESVHYNKDYIKKTIIFTYKVFIKR